jgi:tetratricopeptide (TPR) repeat protein
MKIKTLGILVTGFVLSASGVEISGDWAIKDASVRFVVELVNTPSHPSAGYFVFIQDGGLLPGSTPESVVVDENGNALKSGILWHCKDTGCGLVFEAPQAGEKVVVYFRSASRLNLWTPQSGLTPSAILCAINETRDREDAMRLAALGAVGPKAECANQAWKPAAWGNQSIPMAMSEGLAGGSAMYMLAYIQVTDPGPTWVAPQARSGNMEIAIDGKMLKLAKKNEKVGGVGDTIHLSAGLHKVELYGYSVDPNRASGPMMFSWRTPKTTIGELGGPRAKDLRYPGTSMNESCLIDARHVVKSGQCRVRDIQSRTGPVAAFDVRSTSVFVFPGEDELIAYGLKAWTKNNPPETRYSWHMETTPEARIDGPEIRWLFKGGKYTPVTLTAEVAGKKASARSIFYTCASHSSSLDDENTRQDFNLACYTMLRAYPDQADPLAQWDAAMWNNFFRVFDLKGANPLLEYVVTQRWDFFKKKLDPDKKALLQDVALFSMGPRKPKEAMKWASEFSEEVFPGTRSVVLKLKQAEVLMYYLDDLDGARRIITPLITSSGDGGEWAKVRMGDLEFLSRNINAATQRYGDVQSRSKAEAQKVQTTPLRPVLEGPLRPVLEGPRKVRDLIESRKKLVKGGKSDPKEGKNRLVPVVTPQDPMGAPQNVPTWKLAAIREVAASEYVDMLISQGFYLEAFQALQRWERAFPMAKISGDYILCEAKLYMRLEDYKRARKLLTAYCDQVDVSNFLPEALQMIKDCMYAMKEPDAAIEKLEKEIRKRTVFGGNEE